MTTEQTKAYEAWRSDPAAPNNTKDIFCAGFEAALANRPIVVETIRLVERAEIAARIREIAC